MLLSQARWNVLQASILAAFGTAVAACGGKDAPKDPAGAQSALPVASVPAPTGSPSSSVSPPPVEAGAVRVQQFCADIDARGDRIEGKIDAALSKKKLTSEELAKLISDVSSEMERMGFAESGAASGLRPEDIGTLGSDEGEAFTRCIMRFHARVEAAFKKGDPVIGPQLEALFMKMDPLSEQHRKLQLAWREDIGQARAEAIKQKKPVLVVFCAMWVGACNQMDKTTFRDPSVRALLTQDVVPVRVDATDDEAPSVQKLFKEYKILSLPVLVIFDAQGREQRRFLDGLDAPTLAAALRAAAKPR